MRGEKRAQATLNADLHKKVKLLALLTGKRLSEIVDEAVEKGLGLMPTPVVRMHDPKKEAR